MALAQKTNLRIVEAGPRSLDVGAMISAIADGDHSAAAHFHEATSGLMFGLLLLMLSDTARAEKVLSEVYSEVNSHANRFDRNNDSLLIWLITIAHRRGLECLCSSREDKQFLVSVGLGGSRRSSNVHEFGINRSAHRRLVGATLDSLTSAERRMIELAYFSRMAPRVIATQLRQSPEVVKVGLQTGVTRLYNLFKNQR